MLEGISKLCPDRRLRILIGATFVICVILKLGGFAFILALFP